MVNVSLMEISQKIDNETASEEEVLYFLENVNAQVEKARKILQEIKKLQAE